MSSGGEDSPDNEMMKEFQKRFESTAQLINGRKESMKLQKRLSTLKKNELHFSSRDLPKAAPVI